MKFNYGYEKKKFEDRWKELREEYAAAGMTPEQIEAMYAFDLEVFRSERKYCRHTQMMKDFSLTDELEDEVDKKKSFVKRRIDEKLSAEMSLTDPDRWDGWIDELDNEEMVKAILSLSEKDRMLITLHAIRGYTVTEIARMQGVAQPTITKKVTRIKNYLKNFQSEAMD